MGLWVQELVYYSLKLMETNLVFIEINVVFLVWVLYVCKWGYGDKRKIQRRECLIYGIGLKGLNRGEKVVSDSYITNNEIATKYLCPFLSVLFGSHPTD